MTNGEVREQLTAILDRLDDTEHRQTKSDLFNLFKTMKRPEVVRQVVEVPSPEEKELRQRVNDLKQKLQTFEFQLGQFELGKEQASERNEKERRLLMAYGLLLGVTNSVVAAADADQPLSDEVIKAQLSAFGMFLDQALEGVPTHHGQQLIKEVFDSMDATASSRAARERILAIGVKWIESEGMERF